MTPKKPFVLAYAPAVGEHLRAIEKRHASLIRNKIEEQLRFEPDMETRNRKPMKRMSSLDATWEIRFGPDNQFRVFYDVHPEVNEVHILAIGEKKGNRLLIGGEEFEI